MKTVAIVNVGPKDVTFRCKIDDFFKIRLISFVHVLCPGTNRMKILNFGNYVNVPGSLFPLFGES